MVLIVGATGVLGGEICRRLRARRAPVRALVRATSDPHKVDNLRRLGAQVLIGDLKDPASLADACRDVSIVISTATSISSRQAGDSFDTVDLQGQKNLIDAAAAAGAERFVYVSVFGNAPADSPLVRAKRQVEEYLKGSGLTYTILRPTFFMEIWLSPMLGFDYASGKATIYGSGRNPISWISLMDVAQFAAECLRKQSAQNAVVELGGVEPLNPQEVVEIFEDLAGRRFEVQHVPEDVLQAQRRGATDPVQQSFASFVLGYAAGDRVDMKNTLESYPLPFVSVRDYASRVLFA